jgi:AcrR family transcriptional regulator
MNVHSGKEDAMARPRDVGMEDRILEAAFSVFGERGLRATRIKEIADRAGVAAGSVYTYFSDKEHLFRATVERGWDRFLAELERIAREHQTRQARIEKLLQAGFDTLRTALPLLQGMLFDSSRLNLLRERLEKLCDAIGMLIVPDDRSPARPRLAAGQTRRTAMRVVILGILFSAASAGKDQVSKELEMLKAAVQGILSGGES